MKTTFLLIVSFVLVNSHFAFAQDRQSSSNKDPEIVTHVLNELAKLHDEEKVADKIAKLTPEEKCTSVGIAFIVRGSENYEQKFSESKMAYNALNCETVMKQNHEELVKVQAPILLKLIETFSDN